MSSYQLNKLKISNKKISTSCVDCLYFTQALAHCNCLLISNSAFDNNKKDLFLLIHNLINTKINHKYLFTFQYDLWMTFFCTFKMHFIFSFPFKSLDFDFAITIIIYLTNTKKKLNINYLRVHLIRMHQLWRQQGD